MRRHNLGLVLGNLARSGPRSRSEIASSTHLTRGAVTALVQILSDNGWVHEADSVAGAKGRPRTRLKLTADGRALLALEITSGSVRVIVTTVAGDELLRTSADHRDTDADTVLALAAGLVSQALVAMHDACRRVIDATVIVLAPVGGSPARLLADAVLGWHDLDVVAELEQRVPELAAMPLRLSSDAPLSARAELSRLDGIRNAIYLKGDSNIGGALVISGAPVDGAHGFGGSLGHLPIVPHGSRCACGQHGCLLTVAGIPALLRAAGSEQILEKLSASAALDGFIARVLAGEPASSQAWSDAVPWIGRALRILTMATDPQVIVIGGHWARLTDSIRDAFDSDRPEISASTDFAVTVVPGVLGDDAGLRGALEAARDRVIRDPLGYK